MTTRTIGVVTVARSDFGIYQPVLWEMARTPGLEPKIIATGMHFAPEFGETWRDIESAGFTIDEKVPCTEPTTSTWPWPLSAPAKTRSTNGPSSEPVKS